MHRTAARLTAFTACMLGLGHALFSAYWALGGTWLLDTIGGDLERWGRTREPLVILGLWLVVVLKAGVAVAAPILQYDVVRAPRVPRILSWIAATVLTLYGGILTLAGIVAVRSDVQASDPRALAWHAYFWDPWFLLWGLAFALSLWWSRDR
ncbi:DUF3995 domain-containing protein [Kribbella sp. NPDC050820]|uniref:DUF3995 domain-containing protein n=1 Tax=Kribbella sp. NPDC050820 TaxID=3155408 RepID=UPI0033F4A340